MCSLAWTLKLNDVQTDECISVALARDCCATNTHLLVFVLAFFCFLVWGKSPNVFGFSCSWIRAGLVLGGVSIYIYIYISVSLYTYLSSPQITPK